MRLPEFDPKLVGRGSRLAAGQVIIYVDPRALLAAHAATSPDYARYDKLTGIQAFVESGKKLGVAEVGANNGVLDFTNGRNRAKYAELSGAKKIPIAVYKENVKEVRALLAKYAPKEIAATAEALTVNVAFQDAMLRNQTYILRYGQGLASRITGILDATEGHMAERIAARLAPGTGLTTPAELRRMTALIEQIENIRGAAWGQANSLIGKELLDLSKSEAQTLAGIIETVAPVQISAALPTNESLRSIALTRPFEGRVMRDWAKKMASDDLARIGNAIQLGMVAGEDIPSITKRVLGTKALRGADGMTEVTRRQATAIVRTAVMHISSESNAALMAANADIALEEYFVATLDSRTTPICKSLDGKRFELGKGPRPPLHWQCRSLRVAAMADELIGNRPAKPFVERELIEQYARENNLGKITSRDGLPRGTKGAYDKWESKRLRELIGQVPAKTTYQEWLTRQSNAFQDDTLGKTRAKLFRDGGLKLDRFVNSNGDQLTLKQLAGKHAAEFRAAGLDPSKFL